MCLWCIIRGGWFLMVKQRCEVYSRIVGYIRPLDNWNDAKRAEFGDRVKFVLPGSLKPFGELSGQTTLS